MGLSQEKTHGAGREKCQGPGPLPARCAKPDQERYRFDESHADFLRIYTVNDHQTASKTSAPFQSLSSHAELYAKGKSLREKCPRQSHAVWQPAQDRPDPLRLLAESAEGRIPELIPIRNGRMAQSPFTFYRGAALHMAADMATMPT